MVYELAAIGPPSLKPIQSAGRNRNIAGKAISGSTSEASPTRIHGRGRRM